MKDGSAICSFSDGYMGTTLKFMERTVSSGLDEGEDYNVGGFNIFFFFFFWLTFAHEFTHCIFLFLYNTFHEIKFNILYIKWGGGLCCE